MKATLSLMFLFVGLSSSFAQQTQIDPVYFANGVYSDEVDELAIIQVVSPGGLTRCGHLTPIGVPCACVQGIIGHHDHPRWQLSRPLTWIRPGWHITNYKGEHAGGNVCYKDRNATPEEIERYRRTGF
jgi:hypothetical protein